MSPALANTTIIYVNDNAAGANNGTSWTDAYTSLQTALANANPVVGDIVEIWVAAGTYRPAEASGNRTATFQLKERVAIYGGFAGTETQRGQRDWQANVVILSGDLNGDDGLDFTNNGENSYTVVTGATGATIDGVTITGGNAESISGGGGGGMFNTFSNLTLMNVIISNNHAVADGGGMANDRSDPTLINVTISGNRASFGGGIYNDQGAPALINVVISGNEGIIQGGGMFNIRNSNVTLTNVTLRGNTSAAGRGVVGFAMIRNSILWGNSGGEIGIGGATVSNSIVQGGFTGALDSNPLFVAPVSGELPNTSGNLRLQSGSPAINAGDNTVANPALPATDRDGNPRTIGGTVDMGAYEVLPEITGIARANPSPTTAATVDFTITFNIPVSGVDAADFNLTVSGVSGAYITSVIGSGATWTVTVDMGSGKGTIGLNLADNDTIRAPGDVPLGGVGIGNGNFTGEAYAVERPYLVRLPLVVR